jgi:hypothetical protein
MTIFMAPEGGRKSKSSVTISGIETKDIRFPTSRTFAGSDAMNVDPDYSAAYVILRTNQDGLEGHGLTFTIGRGNDVCCAVIEAIASRLVGTTLSELTNDLAGFWYSITGDSQLRWLGPRERRRTFGGGRGDKRGLGPLCKGPEETAVEAARRHAAGANRFSDPVSLHNRRHHA